METNNNAIIPLKENQSVFFRALGTTFKVLSKTLNGSIAIVEHTLEPKRLGAPMHKHSFEDEISYVLEGSLSVEQNGEVRTAGPGEFIVKPRGIFHTFWNAGEERVRFIETIIPGNFEHYFAEIAPFFHPGKEPEFDKLKAAAARYGLEMNIAASEGIIKKYGLKSMD